MWMQRVGRQSKMADDLDWNNLDWLAEGLREQGKRNQARREEAAALANAAEQYHEELTEQGGDKEKAKTEFLKERSPAKSKPS